MQQSERYRHIDILFFLLVLVPVTMFRFVANAFILDFPFCTKMSLYSLPKDTIPIILDYLPIEDLYKYATNPESIAILKEEIRKRVTNDDIQVLELAVEVQDPLLARYALNIIKTLPQAQNDAYWYKLVDIAIDLRSPMLFKEIFMATNNPLMLVEYINREDNEFFAEAFVDEPELLDILSPLFGTRMCRYIGCPPRQRLLFSPLPYLRILTSSDYDKMLKLLANLHERGIYDYDKRVLQEILLLGGRINGRGENWWPYLPIKEIVTMNREDILSLIADPRTTARDILNLKQGLDIPNVPVILNIIDKNILAPQQREAIIDFLSV